jgi:hypothetical protein
MGAEATQFGMAIGGKARNWPQRNGLFFTQNDQENVSYYQKTAFPGVPVYH